MAPSATKPAFDATKIDLSTGQNVLCSLVASCTAEFSTYPIEVAKVRLQIQGAKALPTVGGAAAAAAGSAGAPAVHYKGLFDAMYKVGRNEGVTKLFAGLPAGLLRHSIAGTLRLGLYDPLCNQQMYGSFDAPADESLRKRPGVKERVTASATTGVIAIMFANPVDLIKTKLQAEGKLPEGVQRRFTGTVSCFQYILKTDGLLGLWAGLSAAIPRMAWQNCAELLAYDMTKDLCRDQFGMQDGLPMFFLGSLSAGFFGAYFGNPLDAVKTRLYNNPPGPDGKPMYSGLSDVVVRMYRDEGVLSFWKGVVPLWIHVTFFSVAVFVTFDYMRLSIKRYKYATGDMAA